ncbi:anaerobic ribonucleoside-triphosphate reductase, partial [Staphylococcus aureus]
MLDGRNNLGVVTINLPRVALDCMVDGRPDLTKFFHILDDRLKICKEALLARIESLRGVTASVAPILYQEGAFGVRLKPN